MRIVQITDWLPPLFSAVSQYALAIGAEEARAGADVTIIGLSREPRPVERRPDGTGSVTVVSVARRPYDKRSWARRLLWTFGTNALILLKTWHVLRQADVIRFTGAPPFLLFFLLPANLLLRKTLVYRITDFYPECIIASLRRPSLALEWLRRLTNVLRRRVDRFEVIGFDMAERLRACGVADDRIVLRRDDSPVRIGPETRPLPRPPELAGHKVVLYSGNWGAAHDVDTFFEAYRRHHVAGPGTVRLWLNATGTGADELDAKLRAADLPFVRQRLVPMEELASLLVSPDLHLITLRPAFTGYVLPSKVYGCIASGKPVLFIGSTGSDVDHLCRQAGPGRYHQADPGDVAGVAAALAAFPWTT